MKFKDKLQYLRKERGYSLEELAELANVSDTSIFFYERNERTPHKNTVIQLAKALDVDPDVLMNDEINIGIEKC